MPWPRQSLFIALVALSAQWATADTITVNTTADTVLNDGNCSLREAVEYFNRGKPSGGYMGCSSAVSDELDIVVLPANTNPYLISSGPIRIHRQFAIGGAGSTGDSKTVVAVQGAHRAFVIYDEPVFRAPVCAATSSCEPAGGPAPDDDAPRLDDASDTGASATDNLTPDHSPLFTGTVQIPASTTRTDTAFPDASTRVETTTVTDSRVAVILYGTLPGGEPKQLDAGYADDTTGNWNLLAVNLADGQYSFHYKRRIDKTVTTNTVTYNVPANTVRSSTSTVDVKAGTTLSDASAAATVAIYTQPSRLTVSLSNLELVGCGRATGCADDASGTYTYSNESDFGLVYDYVITATQGFGGLIYSKEKLALDSVVVTSGVATTGGAIYLANDAAADVADSEFRGNTALDGVAIYSEMNTLRTVRSLFVGNIATGASGAVLHVASSTVPSFSSQSSSEFLNTTVSGNDALALSLRNMMVINNSTIVLNSRGGVDFNGENVSVFNTILAGNRTVYATDPALPVGPFQDCIDYAATATDPALPSIIRNSLVLTGGGCPETGNGMQAISNAPNSFGQLMATNETGGTCNSDYGVLCPLADNGGAFRSHRPNLLGLYASLSDSPIVNRGSLSASGVSGACMDSDQRDEPRKALSCDIGAIELQFVPTNESISSGGSVPFGQTYEQSLDFELADEELLEPAFCPASPPGDPAKVVAGSYRPDVPGCPWLEKQGQKGTASFAAVGVDGRYYYRPGSNFHGFDRFVVRIMTSVSQLNDDPADQSRQVVVTVVVEPGSGIASSNVGGALDEIGLLVMALLGARRFSRRRARP